MPLSIWAIMSAAGAGLARGLLYLNESLDLATAVGIAGFLAVAVGAWLAVHLYRLLIRGYVAWILTIATRADAILKSLAAASGQERPGADGARRASLAARLVAHSFYPTMFSCAAFTYCLLTTILMAQINGPRYDAYVDATIASIVTFVAFVFVQCLYFLYLHRRVAEIERKIEKMDMVPQIVGPAAVLGAGIISTERFSLRFVGIKPSSPERTTV